MLELQSRFSEGEVIAEHYRVLSVAGAGGMGVVYRAQDLRLQRTVALKVLPPSLDVRDEQRFLREARTACSLDHPNIGVIHEVGKTPDGVHFIVMAFYDGASLADKIAQQPFPAAQACDIAIQIAEGLREAHHHGIIHRDIKPSNIMLTNTGVAKIVDFGLAQIASAATATQTGTTGTIAYMSPEQALGRQVDQRTDLWALGATLVELITGRNPFLRDTLPSILFAILNDPPQGMEQLPAALQPVVYRSLAKDPDQRYSSADELLEDLRGARANLPATADASAAKPLSMRESLQMRKVREQASRSSFPVSAAQSRARSPRTRLIRLAIAVPIILFSVYFARWASKPAAAAPDAPHVAVLPFENIGSTPENDVLSAGLMDSLAGRLSDLKVGDKALWVVPDSEVRRLKITDPSEALQKLKANLVVKGSIERDGQHVQLHVNLIDTQNLRQVGSVEVQDEAGDLATLENETVARLAQLMHIPVTADMLRATGGSVTPAAYEDYLTALGYTQRYDKPGNLDLAIASLKKSVATDPQFALGYAALGEAYRLKNRIDHNPRWIDEALANCKHAIQLDDHIPDPYVTVGRIHDAQAQRDLALQEFQHALELDPKNTLALSGLAGTYENSGRIADAEATYKKAIALRPESWDAYNNLGRFYGRHSRLPDAIAEYRKALELTPDNAQLYSNLAAAYIDSGDAKSLAQAEQALKKSIELSPTYPAYANLGVLYMTEKRYADAAGALEHALQLDPRDYMVWNDLTLAYRATHQDAKAADALHKTESLAEQVVAAKPQDAMARSMLATFYAMDELPAKATASIQSALALAPADPNVLSNVGEAYELIGNRRQALRYIRESLDKGYPLDQITSTPELQALVADPAFRPASKAKKDGAPR